MKEVTGGYQPPEVQHASNNNWSVLRRENPDLLVRTLRTRALDFIDEHGSISQSLLARAGAYGLSRAISKYYPGGLRRLKVDMEIPGAVKSPGYWTEERVIEETKNFMAEHGHISQKILEDQGRVDLRHAIG